MKAVFALFLIVAFVGMALAGVHHYRIDGNNGGGQPQEIDGSVGHRGTIFDAIASGINGII